MRLEKFIACSIAALGFSASAALGAEATSVSAPSPHAQSFAALDTNRDGQLSFSEAFAHPPDGQLSRGEVFGTVR